MILDFYLGKNVHPDGFTIEQVWSWDYERLEYTHSYIQWLFPSTVPSQAVPGSPVIARGDVGKFRTDQELRKRFVRSYATMLTFYGFRVDDGKVVRAVDYEEKSKDWVTPSNHNFLRITRIIKAMMMFGFEKNAKEFYAALHQVYRENYMVIGDTTLGFWRRACV